MPAEEAESHNAESFDVEAALTAFLADVNRTELQLPPLDTDQRKQAKKLAEQYAEIKCESYGFGPERRLHLFKQNAASTPKGVTTEGESKEFHADLGSEKSTVVSGAADKSDTPEETEDAAKSAASPAVYQVRNTFIHIEGTDVVDQRAVQSMPHGMFSQCLLDEAARSQGKASTKTTTPSMTPPPTAEAPKEMFAPGTEVVIEGLTKYPAFNGLHGTVLSLDTDTGRYNVQLSSADGSIGQSAKIKGENLRMTVPPPPPFANRADETKSTLHARAPDFVPMHCVGMTNIPPSQPWQDHHALRPPIYDHCQYDPYSYPTPSTMMFAAR
ncbi:unnamed protein product [Effrenium voratum]|nr:unnamed protein product [Effrenium voratum]